MWVLLGHLERGEGPAASDRAAGDDRLGRHLRAWGPDRSGPRGTRVFALLVRVTSGHAPRFCT